MKMVIAVRADLKMGKGKMAAQVAHAALLSADVCQVAMPQWYKAWKTHGQPKVIVRVESIDKLMQIKDLADGKGLPFALVEDRGLTQVPPGTVTCLGIGPAPAGELDKLTGHLRLL